MGQFDLNLSTRPFKPHRAANLGLLALLIALAAISVAQVYSYQQYSSLASGIRANQRKAKEESEMLTKQLGLLNQAMAAAKAGGKIAQVEFLNSVLVRKGFSWTRVFANLEDITPENVHLTSLRPFLDSKGIGLNMVFRGRSFNDATEFVRTIEGSAVFKDIAVAVEDVKNASVTTAITNGEVEMSMSAYYVPGAAYTAGPSVAPAKGED